MAKRTTAESRKIDEKKKPICGIVMPISDIDGCSPHHWAEVLGIVKEAADSAGFDAELVSESDDVGVIQQRIVQNLYDADIVVCDVSAKNANVMFELGLRLAFDKPAIVLKDDKTTYSFDTSPIEHLEYRRDLRYNDVLAFKEKLSQKMIATFEKSSDPEYTTFLKHFGKFKVAGLDTTEVTEKEFWASEFNSLRGQLRRLENQIAMPRLSTRNALARSSFSPNAPSRTEIAQMLVQGLDSGAINRTKLENDHLSAIDYLVEQDSRFVTKFKHSSQLAEMISEEVKFVLRNHQDDGD
ncbi:hypothetical protein ALP8811_01764 [Aliiroseovarius pelagivivens]|uniref:RNA helicase n=1 Tax=Aliiroseovarius pelagivivens TaxID=1639690 RepID=A0A2R8AL61_9RHOB|nr:RNA helicase [Aliiroseovarius pelagivivens]SPF76750.1 hypothetical protein ALP8811_01764 [Aliiroseovarius pelagivivens]